MWCVLAVVYLLLPICLRVVYCLFLCSAAGGLVWRMRHIVIRDQPRSAIFFHISLKKYDFGKKVIEHKTYVLIYSILLRETFLILRRNERDMIKDVYSS